MKIAVQKNDLKGKILYRSLDPYKTTTGILKKSLKTFFAPVLSSLLDRGFLSFFLPFRVDVHQKSRR